MKSFKRFHSCRQKTQLTEKEIDKSKKCEIAKKKVNPAFPIFLFLCVGIGNSVYYVVVVYVNTKICMHGKDSLTFPIAL